MDPNKRSRRQFFSLRTAARAWGEAPTDVPETKVLSEEQASEIRAESYVMHVTREAMACTFEVVLNAGVEAEFAEPALEVLELVSQLEDQLTVYRPESEISQLNQKAHCEPVTVERNLFNLLQKANQIFEMTQGAFDMTAGPLSKSWGFFRREGRIPSEIELHEILQNVGSSNIVFDQERSTIQFKIDGIEINLGGIGKGYALDRCAEELYKMRLENFLMHGGASSILASGERAGITKQGKKGWVIGLRHPIWPEKYLAEIYLHNRALGTSGTARQAFVHEGKKYGHIINPKTGMPSEGILSSTVLAPTAAEADALATSFYVMGAELAMDFCEQHSAQFAAIIVTPGQNPGTIDVHANGLADEDWQLIHQ